jgi:hypothetical protein
MAIRLEIDLPPRDERYDVLERKRAASITLAEFFMSSVRRQPWPFDPLRSGVATLPEDRYLMGVAWSSREIGASALYFVRPRTAEIFDNSPGHGLFRFVAGSPLPPSVEGDFRTAMWGMMEFDGWVNAFAEARGVLLPELEVAA